MKHGIYFYMLGLCAVAPVETECFEVPKGWPTFDASLPAKRMCEEADRILWLQPFLYDGHEVDKRAQMLQYTSALYERYLNTAADQGYPQAIAWRVHSIYTDVLVLGDQITPDIEALKKQVNTFSETEPQLFKVSMGFIARLEMGKPYGAD